MVLRFPCLIFGFTGSQFVFLVLKVQNCNFLVSLDHATGKHLLSVIFAIYFLLPYLVVCVSVSCVYVRLVGYEESLVTRKILTVACHSNEAENVISISLFF